MIGMILVTHGHLAEEFVKAMEHVVGRQENVATVCIGPKDDVEARRKEIAKAIKQVDTGEGVVILTDLAARGREGRSDRRDQPADADSARRRARQDGHR